MSHENKQMCSLPRVYLVFGVTLKGNTEGERNQINNHLYACVIIE